MSQFSSGRYAPAHNPTNLYLEVVRGDIELNHLMQPMFFIHECLEDIALEDGFGDIANVEQRAHAKKVLTRLAKASAHAANGGAR